VLKRIRLRLAAWNLAVLALVLAVTVGSAIVSEMRASELALDHELRDGAARAAARVLRERHEDAPSKGDDDDDDEREHGRREERGDEGAAVEASEEASALLTYSVSGRGGVRSNRRTPVRGLPDEGALRAALQGTESTRDLVAASESVRLLTVPVAHDGEVVGAVQVVKVLRESRAALSRTTLTLVLTGAAGLLLSAIGSWFLAGRAMRPIGEALERQRRFIADASHELRTPVAVVRARAELLQRESAALPEPTRDELDRLHRDAEELSTLLAELLDLARLDAAEGKLPREAIALGDAAEEVVLQLAPLAEQRGLSLTATVEPVWALGHLGRTRQVLRALLDNAMKHTPAGGHIRVSAARRGERALLTVSDDGEGIPAEHLPQVRERFYRVDGTRGQRDDPARRGAGLGLAIASQLVLAMDGELTLESAPGQGTRAIVALPLAPR
jgi:two-component system sensor histidine kinase CiaH